MHTTHISTSPVERLTDEQINSHEVALQFVENRHPVIVSDARALLAELEALRECVGSVRVAGSLGDIVIALVRFDAAVDAARKGET